MPQSPQPGVRFSIRMGDGGRWGGGAVGWGGGPGDVEKSILGIADLTRSWLSFALMFSMETSSNHACARPSQCF